MKQYLILPVFLCISMLGIAQKEFEFGFIAKAGNFTLPKKKLNHDFFYSPGVQETEHSAGSNMTMGIFSSWYGGRRLGFSAELLFRRNDYKVRSFSRFNFTSTIVSGQLTTTANYNTSVSSLVLPLSIFFRHNKFSTSIGAGISHTISKSIAGKVIISEPGMQQTEYIIANNQKNQDGSTNLNLNAGIYYKLESQTSIGIEYVFESQPLDYLYYDEPRLFVDPSIDCFCTTNATFQPNMKSFTIALKHNILGKPE